MGRLSETSGSPRKTPSPLAEAPTQTMEMENQAMEASAETKAESIAEMAAEEIVLIGLIIYLEIPCPP